MLFVSSLPCRSCVLRRYLASCSCSSLVPVSWPSCHRAIVAAHRRRFRVVRAGLANYRRQKEPKHERALFFIPAAATAAGCKSRERWRHNKQINNKCARHTRRGVVGASKEQVLHNENTALGRPYYRSKQLDASFGGPSVRLGSEEIAKSASATLQTLYQPPIAIGAK